MLILGQSRGAVDTNTVLLIHYDGLSGSTTFVDRSGNEHTLTPTQNISVDATTKKYGSGGGEYLSQAYVFQGTNYGYASGGFDTSNVIDKFTFASDANATDVGDLSIIRGLAAGQSATAYGYTSGGGISSATHYNTVDKFSFSTDGNATDVGDLTVTRRIPSGQSSTAYGYTSGGRVSADVNTIDKVSFSTDGTATDVGDLSVSRGGAAGQQQ